MRGGDKLLEQVAGQPLLRVMLERAVAAAEGAVLCALPGPDHPRATYLEDLRVTPVFVTDAAEGMGTSIRAGVTALPAVASAVMILPADMPELTADDLRTMLTAQKDAPHAILRAVDCDGVQGHPVIFPADLFPALGMCHGDMGARDVLRAQSERIVTVPLPDRHATTDLDTPEDWAAWRVKTSEIR
jgi:CTP:molybdopterin cytidylyltransferase MocA